MEVLTAIQTELKDLKSDVVSIKKNVTIDTLNRSNKNFKITPFEFLRKARPEQVAKLLQDEPPKTVALILANLEIDFAASVLTNLIPDVQVAVVKEMSLLGIVSPRTIKEIEEHLLDKLSEPQEIEYDINEGGIKAVVEILNRVDRKTELSVVKALDKESPEISEEIRHRLLVFESIVEIEDRAVQLVLRSVDTKDLAVALTATAQTVQEKIFKNLSKRTAENLREEMENVRPVKIRDVESAQMKIVNIIRRMQKSGEIKLVQTDDKMIF